MKIHVTTPELDEKAAYKQRGETSVYGPEGIREFMKDGTKYTLNDADNPYFYSVVTQSGSSTGNKKEGILAVRYSGQRR